MNKTILPMILAGFAIAIIATASTATAQMNFRPSVRDYKRAEKLLKKMTLDEKIGQLVHIGINAEFMNQDSVEFLRLRRQVSENKIGGIIVFVGGVYETVHLVNRLQEAAEIPLLISADFETGVGMRFKDAVNFPWNMAIGATQNPDFARQMAVITAREARAMGVQQVFAPVVDVNNNAENPVINVRSFGENPSDVARFGAAFSEGLQRGNVLATAKHFPGHGDTAVDSHRGLPVIDFTRERLEKTEFLPFREVVKSGVGSVMISHISMPQLDDEKVEPLKTSSKAEYTESEVITENTTIPATLSKKIVDGILRREMKFDGLIVTDAMDMSGLTLYLDPAEAAVRAILAGNDVLLKPSNAEGTIRGIKQAVNSGRITVDRINESVKRVLAWKHKLGLFMQKITPIEKIDTVVSRADTRLLSNAIAKNAITLVKNEDGMLPLKSGSKVVVLCITNGKDIDSVGGPFISALKNQGLDVERIALDERSNSDEEQKAVERAQNADLVIAGLFGRVRTGEKNSVGIPESGEKVLREIIESDVKTISIAFGNPYLINGFPNMKNYIVSYGDMDSLQLATANAVTGKSEFNGKLPITVGNFTIGTGLTVRK